MKAKKKECEELWSIRYLVRSITKNSDDYDKKNMKFKFNSDSNLSLSKIIEIPIMATMVRAIFHKNNKYDAHDFLDGCLYKV